MPSITISNILGMSNFPFNKKVTHTYRKDIRKTKTYTVLLFISRLSIHTVKIDWLY